RTKIRKSTVLVGTNFRAKFRRYFVDQILNSEVKSASCWRSQMDDEGLRPFHYQPEQWRNEDLFLPSDDAEFFASEINPDAREQSRLLDLLGRINYRILSGNKVYVEVGGVVYKTLYGGYWRSVFTGIQHYLLRCEEIP